MKFDSLTKLVLKTLRNTLTGKIWKWLLGSAGSLIAIVLFGKNFLNQPFEISIYIGLGLITLIFICRFSLFFGINVIQLFHYHFRESIYGDAIILLRNAFSKVHAIRRYDEISDNDFTETMVVFCNNLKNIFEKKAKAQCSVSIKVPTKGSINETSSVQNLCRDSVATKTRDTDIYRQVNHTIIGNTPYHKIVNNILKGNKDKLHYINLDIDANGDYENTSREAYPDGKLPYCSELVYPLLPYAWDQKSNNYDCIGFICIDCRGKNSFDEKYDVGIVSGVADGIYDLITLRNNQKEKYNGQIRSE